MRILLLGKNGQVGWELQRALAPLGELVALARDSPPPLAADFSQPDALVATIRAVAPQLIVNAAAYTGVDEAEAEPELARLVNAKAPAVLAREAARSDAWLLHFSTDYVFDGSGDSPRSEEAVASPLNVYGQTKLEGELAIRASGCKHLILRTSWVYSARGDNFARTMLRQAAMRDRLDVVSDQVGAPTGAELLADIAAHAVRCARAESDLGGTYHAAASGEASWHGYACHVIEFARASGQALKASAESVVPVPSSAFPRAARRPLNSRLDCSKLQRRFGLELPHWHIGLDRMLFEMFDR